MDNKLTREEMIEKLGEIKSRKIDSFGLNKVDRISEENISQITEFDSFLFQDAIQLAVSPQEHIAQFKAESVTRFDKETQLYDVTIGDLGTIYYDYATMFNRFTNHIYAGKVNKSMELLRQFARTIGTQLTQEVKSSIGSHEMSDISRREEEKSRL